jgi:FkbM family methyltransferase
MVFSHQLLCANLIGNEIFNVWTHQAGLGEAAGELSFPVIDPVAGGPNNYGGASVAIGGETAPCLATTVDRLDLSRLDLLKIDVEGAEREVLVGAMGTIARTRPFLFVESFNHAAATMAPDGHTGWLLGQFAGMDYALFHCITPIHDPHAFRGGDTDIFPGQWSFDIVGVPRERGRLTGLRPATDGMFDGPPYTSFAIEFAPAA